MRASTPVVVILFIIQQAGHCQCPIRFSERIVKCDKQFIKKCIPSDYTCKRCWAVDFPACPGQKSGGLDYFSSFENAQKFAETEKKHKWYCDAAPWYDNHNSMIYLEDDAVCSGLPLKGNTVAIKDLRMKVIPFLKRYKAEISNYKNFISGKAYKPGAATDEYEAVIDRGEQNVKILSIGINDLTDDNLNEFEAEFEKITKEEIEITSYKTSSSYYVDKTPQNSAHGKIRHRTAKDTLKRKQLTRPGMAR